MLGKTVDDQIYLDMMLGICNYLSDEVSIPVFKSSTF